MVWDWAVHHDYWSSFSDEYLESVHIEWDCTMCKGDNYFSEHESTYSWEHVICWYCGHPYEFPIPDYQLEWERKDYCIDTDMPWEIYPPDDILF